jgi:hypothetical protein
MTITKFVNNSPNFYQNSPIFNRICNRKTLVIPAFFTLSNLTKSPISPFKIHQKPLSHKAFHDTRLSIHLFQPIQSLKNPCHINIFTQFTYPLTITKFPPHDKQKRAGIHPLFYNYLYTVLNISFKNVFLCKFAIFLIA